MPNFTIVSGEPRSGTSLMMQTLKLLGMTIWHKERENISQELRKQSELLNPKGFYELPIVSKGINLTKIQEKNPSFYQEIIDNDNSVIKLVTHGLINTDINLINKIIFCTRDPRAIAWSQTDLVQNVMVSGKDGEWIYPKLNITCNSYIVNIYRFLQKLPEFPKKIIYIDYQNMNEQPDVEINKIIEFLEISPTEKQIQDAINNVDPDLNRSSDPPILTGSEWDMADRLYNILVPPKGVKPSYDTDLKTNFTNVIKELSHSVWLEESVWRMCDVSMFNKIQNDKSYKKALLLDRKKREIKRMVCSSCENFNRNGSEYTISREGIVPLTRKKVMCSELNREVTLEECQRHWSIKSKI